MANPMMFYTALGMAKESSWGTDTAPTVWHPITNPRFDPGGLQHIMDDNFRGLAAVDFDMLPGPGNGSFSFGGGIYMDSSPMFFASIIGPDAIAGASPYTHTFALTAAPDSHSLEEQTNVQSYRYNGSRLTEFGVSFNAATGMAQYSVQGASKVGLEQASPTSTAFTAESAISAVAGWQGSLTVAGGAAAILLEGQVTFSRQQRIIHGFTNTAGGSQDVNAMYPLALQVTARLTFNYSQSTELYMAYPKTGQSLAGAAVTKNAVVISLKRSATEIMAITLTKAAWRQFQRENQDGTYTGVALLHGIYNATDAGPVKVVCTNNRSTAY